MNVTAETAPAPTRTLHPLHAVRVGADRIRLELLEYTRRLDNLFFTFTFPIMLLLLFGSAFGSADPVPLPSGELDMGRTMLPAMAASAVLLSGTQNIALSVGIERWDGTLRRLSAMPIPKASYFIGKFGQVILTSVLQMAALLAVGRLVFGFDLPQTGDQWAVFGWAYALGLLCFSLLGLLLAQVPRSTSSVSAIVIPVVLIPQFISGVYLSVSMLPDWLIEIANLLPLAWLAHAMRFAFLPEDARLMELGEEWDLGRAALMLALWTVAALITAMCTFRWVRRD